VWVVVWKVSIMQNVEVEEEEEEEEEEETKNLIVVHPSRHLPIDIYFNHGELLAKSLHVHSRASDTRARGRRRR
jgi:hypothetical protein